MSSPLTIQELKKTTNPDWNQTFALDLKERNEVIYFEVWNHNTILRDDLLGKASVPLGSLQESVDQTLVLKLTDTTSGELKVVITVGPKPPGSQPNSRPGSQPNSRPSSRPTSRAASPSTSRSSSPERTASQKNFNLLVPDSPIQRQGSLAQIQKSTSDLNLQVTATPNAVAISSNATSTQQTGVKIEVTDTQQIKQPVTASTSTDQKPAEPMIDEQV